MTKLLRDTGGFLKLFILVVFLKKHFDKCKQQKQQNPIEIQLESMLPVFFPIQKWLYFCNERTNRSALSLWSAFRLSPWFSFYNCGVLFKAAQHWEFLYSFKEWFLQRFQRYSAGFEDEKNMGNHDNSTQSVLGYLTDFITMVPVSHGKQIQEEFCFNWSNSNECVTGH